MAPATNDCCRKCGKKADEVCSGCKAPYCSVACQTWDWKEGGHRALCKGPASNRKIRSILCELFVAEWEWLQGLSRAEKEELFSDCMLGCPLNHLFRGGEVALVLARANACAILKHRGCRREYGPEYYAKVLEPWYNKHMEFLNEQGFVVEYIDHGVFVSGHPSLNDYGGAALVKDIRSPKIELVNKIFTISRIPLPFLWREEEAVTWQNMVDCISFAQTREGSQESGSAVEYYFQFPKQVFGGDANVCCSSCTELKFVVDPEDATALGEHFHQSYEAMAKLGFPIQFGVMHQEDWPDSALAKAWYAACGKKIDTFKKWMRQEDSGILFKLDGHTKDHIIDLVYEMPD